MYDTKYFKANSEKDVLDFMRAHPFVIVCASGADGVPVATHIPVLFKEREGQIVLQAHIQRNTDHHKAFENNPDVLVIFNGAHSYVSASWYTNPQMASTWNYQAVHATGRLQFCNEEQLRALLESLTAHFENNAHSPALVKHMSEEYIQQQMKAIIAFEITLTQIRHVFKLSQNRDETSKQNIIHHLTNSTDADANAVANVMKALYDTSKK